MIQFDVSGGKSRGEKRGCFTLHGKKKKKHLPGTLNTSFLWLFQLDDSKSLHGKWLFHQTSIYTWLFRVPGTEYVYI